MGVALIAFKEKRLSHRKRLTGLLPGRLTIEGTKGNINCRPVDLSPHGLGVLIQSELSIGAKAQLQCAIKGHSETIELSVAWVRRDFGKQDLFRVGFVTDDPSVDLESIFSLTGCYK